MPLVPMNCQWRSSRRSNCQFPGKESGIPPERQHGARSPHRSPNSKCSLQSIHMNLLAHKNMAKVPVLWSFLACGNLFRVSHPPATQRSHSLGCPVKAILFVIWTRNLSFRFSSYVTFNPTVIRRECPWNCSYEAPLQVQLSFLASQL